MKNIFRFRSIRSKMFVGFAMILALLIALNIFNYLVINETNDNTRLLADEQVPLLVGDQKLAYNAAQLMAATRGYVLYGDDEYLDMFAAFSEDSELFKEQVLAVTDDNLAKELISKNDEWREYVSEYIISEYEQGNTDIAAANLKKSNELIREVMNGFNELAIERETMFYETADNIITRGEYTLSIELVVTIVAVVIAIITAIVTANSITRPIQTVMDKMKVIANGDLTHENLVSNARDETGQLFDAANEMNDTMKAVLEEIQAVSNLVGKQSDELTQSANEVTFGTEQIAATMEELAAGAETEAGHASQLAENMELFTTHVNETSQGGQAIEVASNNVLTMTIEGQELMTQSTEQMNMVYEIIREAVDKVHVLNTESEKISELVEVIQGIAEQTNLLALNAAIEAARAGEQGQGFAVVADEVRKLAEGVSHSVTDITGIVASIQSQSNDVTTSLENGYEEVSQGTSRVVETGETFSQITTAIEDVVRNINGMADHLNNITNETSQMSRSVQEIAAISEESAAGIEETSASSVQMSSSMTDITRHSTDVADLAEQLDNLVKRFKI